MLCERERGEPWKSCLAWPKERQVDEIALWVAKYRWEAGA